MSSIRRDAVRVEVPASSANLGPGFDSAGLALGLYDELIAMATDDEGVLVEVAGEGAGAVPLDDTHLVVRSMALGFDWLGVRPAGFVLRCVNAVPQGRGLGSSASAIIGGLVMARGMVDDGAERMTDADLLQIALGVESHPDNLSAALFGGFTVAWLEADGFGDCMRLDVHPDIHPVVLVPGSELATSMARAILPEQVSFADASANLSRYALLVLAMTQDPRRLMTATEDRLHQAARSAVYPDSVALVGRLRDAGVPAVISGAGPSVLALSSEEVATGLLATELEGWRAMSVPVSATGARVLPLQPEGSAGLR